MTMERKEHNSFWRVNGVIMRLVFYLKAFEYDLKIKNIFTKHWLLTSPSSTLVDEKNVEKILKYVLMF